MADGKAFAAWLSGDLLSDAEKRADVVAEGNASKYVKALIERDVATTPQTLLIELARQFHPTLVPDLERALASKAVDGRKVIARFLDAYLAALGDRDFKPEQGFELLSKARRQAFEEVAEDRLEYLAQKVAEIQQSRNALPARPRKKRAKARSSTGQPKLIQHSTDQPA